MNILVISDYFKEVVKDENIEFINWSDGEIKTSLNEFHIVIIDISFPEDKNNLNSIKDTYLDLENKLTIDLIEKDGIVLVIICGYENKGIFSYFDEMLTEDDKYPGSHSEEKEKKTYNFLARLNMQIYKKIDFVTKGKRFTLPTNSTFQSYFKNVDRFFLTIPHDESDENVSSISKAAGVGDKCISFAINSGNGFIVFLPAYKPENRFKSYSELMKISNLYFLKQQNKFFENERPERIIPEWVSKYKTNRHKAIPGEINKLHNEEEYFNRISFLLYGKHVRLEDEIKLVFEDLGMKVLKTGSRESVDLICTSNELFFEFFIEITGSNYSVNMKDRKINQVMQFKANNPDKNVILLANTFTNLDLHDRLIYDSFAEKVVGALNALQISMMTTADLYFLWKGVYEKKLKSHEALKLIKKNKSIFLLPQSLIHCVLRNQKEENNV